MTLRQFLSLRRILIASTLSILLHGLLVWGPEIRLPQPKPELPPLVARLEQLPTAPPAKRNNKSRPASANPRAETPPPRQSVQQDAESLQTASATEATSTLEMASAFEAASEPAEAATLAAGTEKPVPRPPLPRQARLTFMVNKGINGLRVGEAVHTLEINNDGHYVLQAETRTIGLVRLFKRFDILQYSSGSYLADGLHPESFFEERKDGSDTQRHGVEFDRKAGLASFSDGQTISLPPGTQDILSIMYQFPPLQNSEIANISVSNGRKIENYNFEIDADEKIDTPIGELLAVRLRKLHKPNEEGLDIWLAREYRLFPVMMRFIERNGEITGEAVITDIRVSGEEGETSNAAD